MGRPGDQGVLRQLFGGRIWSVLPAVVVEDSVERLALWLPPGVVGKTASGDLFEGWTLADRTLERRNGILRVTEPGEAYSILHFWREDGSFAGWYVNLEQPLRRSSVGWDFEDELLDVWLEPGGSWRWLDEDELERAVELGLRSESEARAIRAAGERALEHLLGLQEPSRTGWEDWRPDPGWDLPALPGDWDAAPGAPRALR